MEQSVSTLCKHSHVATHHHKNWSVAPHHEKYSTDAQHHKHSYTPPPKKNKKKQLCSTQSKLMFYFHTTKIFVFPDTLVNKDQTPQANTKKIVLPLDLLEVFIC